MQNVQATASHLMSQQSKQIALSVHSVTHLTAVTSSCLLISTVNSCSASSSSSDSSICNTKVRSAPVSSTSCPVSMDHNQVSTFPLQIPSSMSNLLCMSVITRHFTGHQ